MRRTLLAIALVAATAAAWAQGVPFLRNYSATEYQAHNRNFDITTDGQGFVYVANFEGLLYYDYAEWRIIHTPQNTRITTLYRDTNGTVWAGGYNYLGRIEADARGQLVLSDAVEKGSFHGVVEKIWDEGKLLMFKLEAGPAYTLDTDGKIETVKKALPEQDQNIETINLGSGLKARATESNGVEIIGSNGQATYHITESNGLCSNAINKLAYNGKGLLWGATNDGLFCIALPTAYTHATALEGLRGEALSMLYYGNTLYVGTTNGLFYYDDNVFNPVAGMPYQCWQMATTAQGLLAATSNGVYRLSSPTAVTQLTGQSALSVSAADDGFFTGELNSVFFNHYDGSRMEIDSMERVTHIYADKEGTLWLQNLYGTIKCRKATEREFSVLLMDNGQTGIVVPTNQGLKPISTNQVKPIPYPQFAYMDKEGVTWLTESNGRGLYCMKDGKKIGGLESKLYAISDYNVRSMLHHNDQLMMGGDFGLITLKLDFDDPILEKKSVLRICTVKLGGDSILWGGYGDMPKRLPALDSHERHLEFTYALDNVSLVKQTLYRYRLNGGPWSAWDDEQEAKFPSLAYGSHTFEVQAKDAYGNVSDPVGMEFNIQYPFYQRWYMLILYAILIGAIIYIVIRLRLQRLEREKIQLENIVQERTAHLQTALHELSDAQNELIRQEKMATVGKLTQGLIDRILNPLNYINNFSKLSEGLVKDIEANIEDEKANMDEENYEDTLDVLSMLRGNLQKVGEHGASTTRTLKAMEEMLKDRSGGIVETDLTAILRQDEDMLRSYYADAIAKDNIGISFELPQGPLKINGNPDQLSKTFMSLLGNAVYAIGKKAQRQSYQAEIAVKVAVGSDKATLTFRDNGIGIEQTIIDKVFDPFFTTKTTGEAAGVGLYLSREIVQNHGGDISVESVKDEYTEFTITIPTL